MSEEVSNDPYIKALLDQTTSLARNAQKGLDEYLQKFFGTQENAERYGHLYILEQYPDELKTEMDKDHLMRVSMNMTYRLRLKTPEELRDSR
jgi:hypothetical protein